MGDLEKIKNINITRKTTREDKQVKLQVKLVEYTRSVNVGS